MKIYNKETFVYAVMLAIGFFGYLFTIFSDHWIQCLFSGILGLTIGMLLSYSLRTPNDKK